MMKRNLTLLAGLFLALGINHGAMAAKMPMKSYHQEMFTSADGSVDCQACHGDQKPFSAPATETCLGCHGPMEDLVDSTKRPGHGAEFEPNPHDSLHYGTDLNCAYCHAEHKKPQVYCNQCHEFKYPEMKRK
ncbi:tetraheme cytochrome c [Ferrimonas balearica DSM 9799]|uniref:Tetraheme cytochrome c n=1 Tax=Ferrimonas balearica (strain DSM 9799 / CCM 4581 / KCTC 23876 / PAT) TaxID=550540 RepID=E1SV36_FERBD|nr:cytochrome c3 family protein [Ferrimonas balearica]ADN77336.1 tetraheme cytochrome c [Ferrimonas balearica DSM 9799]MBW3139674.1 cytochrome c3 family protein [Ferrimonas balearica]MBW3164700.1 cytochrome c3 family protein [Ferrimonas balearica]MBY5980438.1 cytochrome c3 family protein [Ferrimonas balearica]MBY6094191.1 cytochrome c3 family protein [Ferrimonas balearica]